MQVAYQGEPGAYSERAVRSLFPDADPMPCETVRLVFSRVTSGEADHGVVPLENSQAGSVNETYDQLQHTSLLHIVGEVLVRVDHALLGVSGARSRRSVAHSHWQRSPRREFVVVRIGRCPCDTAGAARPSPARRPGGRRTIMTSRQAPRSGSVLSGGSRPKRELHEVRRDLDQRSRSRTRGQGVAGNGRARPPRSLLASCNPSRNAHRLACSSPGRGAASLSTCSTGSHGPATHRGWRTLSAVAEHTSLLRVLGGYRSASEPV
jgi:hypothetical protein